MGKYTFIRIFGVFSIFAMFIYGGAFAGGGLYGYGSTGSDCGSGWWWTGNYCEKCPVAYPESSEGASKEEDCFKQNGNTVDHYKPIICQAGSYLEKNKDTCLPCKANNWCPGGTFPKSATQRQGMYACPKRASGWDPEYQSAAGSDDVTDCYQSNPISGKFKGCSAGYYFSVQVSYCIQCPDTHPMSDQGSTEIKKCYKQTNSGKSFYSQQTCDKGKYLPAGANSPIACLSNNDGYFCNGGSFFVDTTKDQGLRKCPQGYSASNDNEKCTLVEGLGSGGNGSGGGDNLDSHGCKSGSSWAGQAQYYENGMCKDCPNKFKASDKNATKQSQCFRQGAGGGKLYYKKTTCQAGRYLPALRNDCEVCPDDNKSYCPNNGTYWPSDQPQGKKECGAGQVPNSHKTACVNSSGGDGCGSGYYKPAGGSCTPCPDGFDKSDENAAEDTQCYTDIDGENFYYEKAEKCNVGEYLPAKQRVCKPCVGTNKYCPGNNTFYKHPKKDQGIYDCPMYGVTNSNKSACNLQIPKLNMKNGPLGANSRLADQCWFKPTIQQYTKCLLSGSATELGDE